MILCKEKLNNKMIRIYYAAFLARAEKKASNSENMSLNIGIIFPMLSITFMPHEAIWGYVFELAITPGLNNISFSA